MPLYIDRWLDRSKPDYYMMFVSAWIPFNAWYNADIAPHVTGKATDASCIEYICTHANKYKDRIMWYLNDNGSDGKIMRKRIADLQRLLIKHPIPNAASPINFSTIKVSQNSTHLCEKDYRGFHYKWEFVQNPVPPAKRFQLVVSKAGITRCSLDLDKWSIEDLKAHANYIACDSAEMKHNIVEYFKEINPKKPLDVMRSPVSDGHGGWRKPSHAETYDEANHIYMDDNRENVCKVLINLIYQLRCQIFHGALDPSIDNLEVYEEAYNIQSKFIEALR